MIGRREVVAAMAGSLVMPRVALAADRRMFKASIALENNRVLVAVGMNGKGPYIFMIDTGAYVSLIRPELAKELGLLVMGHEGTSGIGGKGRPFAIYRARDFIIGGSIRQSSVVLEDSFEFGYQSEIYGALAAGILTAQDADLDFDAGELRIYPDGRGDRSGFVALDSEIPRAEQPNRGSRQILATVTVDGRPVRCLLDTGSPNTLSLDQAAARRLGLWDGRPFAPVRPNGIGGTGPIGRIVRVGSIGMGGLTVDRPQITLLGNDIGGRHDGFEGIVGLSIIRRFNLSIDTRGRKLWVKPSRQSSPPGRYGLSGLWLDRDGARIKVAEVGTGSPAAKAGIAVGDEIDGDWDNVLRAIGGPADSIARLAVKRGGDTREVALTLAPYL